MSYESDQADLAYLQWRSEELRQRAVRQDKFTGALMACILIAILSACIMFIGLVLYHVSVSGVAPLQIYSSIDAPATVMAAQEERGTWIADVRVNRTGCIIPRVIFHERIAKSDQVHVRLIMAGRHSRRHQSRIAVGYKQWPPVVSGK